MSLDIWLTAHRAESRNFFVESRTPVGASRATRWLIMQIETKVGDPFDWVGVSRDFSFSQNACFVERTYEVLVTEIESFINKNTPQYDQPLYADVKGQPWVIAMEAASTLSGSAQWGVGVTGAYDGITLFPGSGLSLPTLGKEYSTVVSHINDFARAQTTAIPAPAILGYGIADLPPPVGPLPPGGGPTDPTKPPVPGVPGTPPLPPPPAAQASSGVSPLLLAGIAAAGVYWFTQRNNPRGGSPRGSR